MKILNEQLIQKVISEIEIPQFDSTMQYLKSFSVDIENGKPKIELIERDVYNEVDVVFVRVKEEPFFLAFSFSKDNSELLGTFTENSSQIYFTATSNSLTFQELSEMTKLKNLKGWSFDQLRPNGKSKYGFSRIIYEPIENRAFDFGSKMNRLLADLESDAEGIIEIAKLANAIVSIHLQMYISGNKGIFFNNQTIKTLNDLNLEVDIDQYVHGIKIE